MEGIGPFWVGAYLNITTAVLKHDESAFFFFRMRDLKPYADCQQHNMGTCSKKPWDFPTPLGSRIRRSGSSTISRE